MAQTTGERLRELRTDIERREGRRVYQRDIAKFLGINEATYRSYEYDKAKLPEEHARRLAAEYRKDRDWRWFYIGDADDVGMPMAPAPLLLVPIPYLGALAASGPVDWTDPLESEDFMEVPPEMAERSGRFCSTVVGDSCYDLLLPGDLVVFHKDSLPKLGQMVMHRSPDRRVTVKQLKHDGEKFILHPLNRSYKDEAATGVFLGYLVGIVRQIGSKRVTVYDLHGIVP